MKRSVRLMIAAAALGGAATPQPVLAKGGHAQAGPHLTAPTAFFTPPAGCIPDAKLAATALAVQACIERFSPTHEFVITLKEYRVRNERPDVKPDAAVAKSAALQLVANIRKANEGQPGQILSLFEFVDTPPQGGLFPPGADYCVTVISVVIDRRVPGFGSEQFRIWGNTFICARADLTDNSIQVVELRASERFRVATDNFKERFKVLAPAETFDRAIRTLKMVPAP